jgi:hypothetical protein
MWGCSSKQRKARIRGQVGWKSVMYGYISYMRFPQVPRFWDGVDRVRCWMGPTQRRWGMDLLVPYVIIHDPRGLLRSVNDKEQV